MVKTIALVIVLLLGSFIAAWGQSSTLSNLSSGIAISNSDLFYDVQTPGIGGVKVTGSQFLNYIFGNVSGGCSASSSGVFTCGTLGSLAAGTNINTSGTAGNITVSVVPSPTFGALTVSTVAAISGFLTASGANFQTATILGPITISGSIVTKVRSATATTASATTDYFLCLDPTASVITLTLPGSPLTGLTYLVKDCTGQAATHNIIVTGTNANIDGAGSFAMSTNYQSIGLTYNGTQWSVN